jgi:flagellar biogenesis protein FliO
MASGASTRSRRNASATQNDEVTSMVISVLITVLVVVLLLYLVDRLPIAGRGKQVVRVVIIVLGVLSLLKYLNVEF